MRSKGKKNLWLIRGGAALTKEIRRLFPDHKIKTRLSADSANLDTIVMECHGTCCRRKCTARFQSAAKYPEARVIIARSLLRPMEEMDGSSFFWVELAPPRQESGRGSFSQNRFPRFRSEDLVISFQTKIHECRGNVLSLGAMIRLMGMNPASFSRKFKQMTGMSPKEYCLMIRLCHALWDLVVSKKSVKETAYDCGYHPNSFSRVFAKTFGVPPSRIASAAGSTCE